MSRPTSAGSVPEEVERTHEPGSLQARRTVHDPPEALGLIGLCMRAGAQAQQQRVPARLAGGVGREVPRQQDDGGDTNDVASGGVSKEKKSDD